MPVRSAAIVPISLPSRPALLRDAGDRMAARHPPFVARFSRIERREEMVWLVPTSQRPFLGLTDSVAAVWCRHQDTDRPSALEAGIRADRLGHASLLTRGRGYATGAARRVFDDAGADPGWPRTASVTTSGAPEAPPDPA